MFRPIARLGWAPTATGLEPATSASFSTEFYVNFEFYDNFELNVNISATGLEPPPAPELPKASHVSSPRI